MCIGLISIEKLEKCTYNDLQKINSVSITH